MRLLDQARAIARLVFFNSERDTVSEQALHAAEMARLERERTKQAMDKLLLSLMRQNAERRIEGLATSSQSINGTIRK